MGFKSKQVTIATSDTDVYQMGAGLAGVAVVSVGNQTSGAIGFTVKVFKQATGATTTIVTSQSAPANKIGKIDPIALEAGDKIIMSAISAGITASVLVTDSAVAAAAKGYNPRGAYTAIGVYAQNDVVTGSDGASYISMVDGNSGNDPVSSPTFWMVNAAKGQAGSPGDTAFSTVRFVVTSNVNLSSALVNGATFDGVTAVTGDLALVIGQTLGAENGVYPVVVSGAASRAATFNTYDSHPGRYFSVMEGMVGADKLYRCTSNKGGTLGTTALDFSEFKTGTVLRGYLNGGTLSNSAVTPNTVLDVAAVLTADDTGAVMISLGAGSIDFATNGANGLDTGSFAASKSYHAFVIAKADGTAARIASLSATAPSLPSGYVYKRRLGMWLSDASVHLVPILQMGQDFIFATPFKNLAQAGSLGINAVLQASGVPTGVSVRAKIGFNLLRNPATGGVYGYLSSPLVPAVAPGADAFSVLAGTQTSGDNFQSTAIVELWTDVNGRYRYQLSASGSDILATSLTYGWYDPL